jgi:GNAT superfamily N-acetyltransferase
MTSNHLDSVRETLLALYDREQRIRIEYPGHSKETLPHVVRFVRTVETGRGFISYTWMNGGHPTDVVREQVDYFRALKIPFEWMVCEHDSAPGLKEALLDNGFKPDLDPGDPGAVLVLDLKSVPPSLAAPKAQDVRRITRPEGLADVRHVMQQVWGDSFDWLQPRLGAHLAIPGYLSVYASYEQDEAVCAGWTYYPPGSPIASLFGGSTVEKYRRRGHYTALLAARAQEAARRGQRYLLIHAGLESRPVAEKNGFQVLTYACSYEWKPIPQPASNL